VSVVHVHDYVHGYVKNGICIVDVDATVDVDE
jgi:hypothetical protein